MSTSARTSVSPPVLAAAQPLLNTALPDAPVYARSNATHADARSAAANTAAAGDCVIDVRAVRKTFESQGSLVTALSQISLSIHHNEFFTLLGPSGCGKTTLLRLLAGFEQPSAGEILLSGEPVQALPPYKRSINTVFQHYALFPNMTVAENIGFGLRMLRLSKPEIAARVDEMLALVKMERFADRRTSQLSGGQQQRIALARALAPRPKVLLLDEPLSALDLKLRQAMRLELKALQAETGITFVFVTHDQEEALAMSDRIAVMSEGAVQQIGRPDEIYNQPANRFVAQFIGENNLLEASVMSGSGEAVTVEVAGIGAVTVASRRELTAGQELSVAIRPEKLSLAPQHGAPERIRFDARVVATVYLGTDTAFHVELANGQRLIVRDLKSSGGGPLPGVGDSVAVEFAPADLKLLGD